MNKLPWRAAEAFASSASPHRNYSTILLWVPELPATVAGVFKLRHAAHGAGFCSELTGRPEPALLSVERARCEKCGQDFLVAYWCKGCGV